MKILVTGGTGFIGSNLALALLTGRHEVLITGAADERAVPGAIVLPRNLDEIDRHWLKGIGAVFHQSANNDTMDNNKEAMFEANVLAPQRLFYDLYERGCRKFIYASSTAVYGDSPSPYVENETPCRPLNIYGESKLEFEKFADSFASRKNVGVIGLRYCNVYGPGEEHKGRRASMIHQLIKTIQRNERPVLFQYGWQRRDWIAVEDVVKANLSALKRCEYYSGVCNCGTGQSLSFNRILEIINDDFDTWVEPQYKPCPFPQTFQVHTRCDMERAKKVLNFRPRNSVERGIHNLVRWHKMRAKAQ